MNRNVESHFSQLPEVDFQRSIFDRSHTHKTSMNVGDLVPFYVDEVLPGDTFNVTTSKVVRLQTLLNPVLDNLYLDVFYYFIPMRLTWSHTKEFFGENTSSPWVPSVSYQIPSISSPSGGFATGTIADYMGLPVGVSWSNSDSRRPSALPFRAYALVCNEFFRDENLTDPLNIPTGDSNQTGSNGTNYINDVANGGMPFKAAKYHDYFTSCLPSPLKAAQSVTFPLINGDKAPVHSYNVLNNTSGSAIPSDMLPLVWMEENSGNFGGLGAGTNYLVTSNYGKTLTGNSISSTPNIKLYPSNLWADLSTSVGAVSINELRLAFQLQKYFEKQARSGSRYIEYLQAFFGVTSPDARLQRPEYLGGNRIPVNIHEVVNTSESSSTYLGDLGAMSVTSDIHEDFVHSFTEHGFVLGLAVLRYDHSYAQGLERFWSRRDPTDFYLPVFANIGEQPVYKCEIYCDSTTIGDNSVFGYQEAWAEYRFKPDRISGELRPGISNTLASWHFSDYYTQAPTLSDSWIREDLTNVDRTLAVTSSTANQAFMDIYIKNICTRVMPVYSVPGLIDHH